MRWPRSPLSSSARTAARPSPSRSPALPDPEDEARPEGDVTALGETVGGEEGHRTRSRARRRWRG